jgi:hypothetical protein
MAVSAPSTAMTDTPPLDPRLTDLIRRIRDATRQPPAGTRPRRAERSGARGPPPIARGETNRGAAAHLFISEATVKTHLLHIYAKLDVNDRAAAVAVAYDRGLLAPRSD